MENNEFRADIIEVVVKGAIKTEHTFTSGEKLLGVLNLKGGRMEGVFLDSDGGTASLKRTSIWKSKYEWHQEGRAVGLASPRAKLSRAFNVSYQGKGYGLFPGGKTLRSWTLKDFQSAVVCEVQPRGVLKRGALIWIRNQIPLNLLVFVYCLVSKRWQEASSS